MTNLTLPKNPLEHPAPKQKKFLSFSLHRMGGAPALVYMLAHPYAKLHDTDKLTLISITEEKGYTLTHLHSSVIL